MASIPSIATISVGQKVTAAYLNSLRDAVAFLTGVPLVVLTASVAQTITTGTTTGLTWDTEGVDNDNTHSTVTTPTTVVCVTPGWYDVSASDMWAANVTGSRYIAFFLNSVEFARTEGPANAAAGRGTGQNISAKLFLNAGDQLQVVVWQNSGGNLATTVGAGTSRFAAEWRHA